MPNRPPNGKAGKIIDSNMPWVLGEARTGNRGECHAVDMFRLRLESLTLTTYKVGHGVCVCVMYLCGFSVYPMGNQFTNGWVGRGWAPPADKKAKSRN